MIDFYDSVAVGYDHWAGGVHRRVAARLADLSGAVPGDRVLDIGTGTGLVAHDQADRTGPEGLVIGIDISEGMLDEARRKGMPSQLRFYGMAAEDLIFRDDSFDVVCFGQSLNCLLDPLTSLAEVARVLRPGGRIAISLRSLDLSTQAQQLFFTSLAPLAQRYAITLPTFPEESTVLTDKAVLRDVLGHFDFGDLRITQMVTGGRARTARELMQLLAGVGPKPFTLISALGSIPRAAFEADLMQKMEAVGEDSFSYHFTYLFVSATHRER